MSYFFCWPTSLAFANAIQSKFVLKATCIACGGGEDILRLFLFTRKRAIALCIYNRIDYSAPFDVVRSLRFNYDLK